MSIKTRTNSILSLISKFDSNKDKFPGAIFYKAIDNYLNRYYNMKRVLFSLIACFCFLSANTQVLNLYLKGGVLPINTYDIDSIRLVPEQEIPTYDVKGILTSAEDGWVYGNIKGLWTYSVLKFLNEGFVSVQDYHINNDSLSLYNTNLYSFSISPTNRLLLSGDYNYSGDNQYSEYIITDINEERIALACCYSLNNTLHSRNI